MANRPQIPSTSSAQAGELLELRGMDGGALTREQLATALAEGNLPTRVQFDALVYRQPETPNRNFVRFKTGKALSDFAASFKGQPFLRDHERSLAARGGTIRESSLVTRDGVPTIKQTIELTTAWAVQALAEGAIDRFSIGWGKAPGGDVVCSICGDSMWGRGSECSHWPGNEYKVDVDENGAGQEKVCEMIYTAALGDECSAVVVPAVGGTEIEGIRAALAAEREEHRGERPQKDTIMPELKKKLCAALGLDENVSDEVLLKHAAEARVEREAHAATKEALTDANAKLEALQAAEQKAKVDGLIERARREGKLKTQGSEETVKAIRSLAAASLSAAEEIVNNLPKLVPVGPAKSLGKAEPELAPVIEIDSLQKKANKQLGISDAMYLKYGVNPDGSMKTLEQLQAERAEKEAK